jgi:hypothetical protein
VGWRRRPDSKTQVRLVEFCLIYAFIESRRRYFRDQPLLHPDVTDQHLIIWYFEDWLKNYFFSYLQILEVSQESLFCLARYSSFPGLLFGSSPICPHAVPCVDIYSTSLSSGTGTKSAALTREQACALTSFLSVISFRDTLITPG